MVDSVLGVATLVVEAPEAELFTAVGEDLPLVVTEPVGVDVGVEVIDVDGTGAVGVATTSSSEPEFCKYPTTATRTKPPTTTATREGFSADI